MQISIHKSIADVKREFSGKYPFLKLEFFSRRRNGDARHLPFLSEDLLLSELHPLPKEGKIDIKGSVTIRELEKKLAEEFQLQAQVFRRSGNVWLETTMTDGWTLAHQNEHGRDISLVGKSPNTGTGDYELNRGAD